VTRKRTTHPKGTARPDVGHSPPTDETPPRALPRRKKLIFGLVAAVLIAGLLIGGLEVALRVAGYGYPAGFFVRHPVHDQPISNAQFGRRFFPPAIARVPTPLAVTDPKPRGAFRIFVMGGSAALGTPAPHYGFSRILEVMLAETFPDARIEVINTAMVAINSHVVRSIAADCADWQPDLFIVYLGNNEVVGPFGAGTVFQGATDNLTLLRTGLWFRKFRAGQWVASLFAGSDTGGQRFTEWKGMEFFLDNRVSADDPRLTTVYASFARNLSAICDTATGAGAGTILCTVGVNLKDSAPFASTPDAPRDDATAKGPWAEAYQAGLAHLAEGNAVAALAALQQAEALDDKSADLQFHLGTCRAAQGETQAAREHFARARDLDELRFRADTRINQTIRDVAAQAGPRVKLVDVARLLETDTQGTARIPGNDLFYEHCHYRFAGNYALASHVFPAVVSALPKRIRGDTQRAMPIPTLDRCAARLAHTRWDAHAIAQQVRDKMSHPPYTNQIDHTDQLARLDTEIDGLLAGSAGVALREAAETYEQAVRQWPSDLDLRRGFAEVLAKGGMFAEAAGLLREALARFPLDPRCGLLLGSMQVSQGDLEGGLAQYENVLASPYCDRVCRGEIHYGQGVVYEKQHRPAEAEQAYQEAIRLRPSYVKALTNLALLLRRADRDEAALPHLKRVIEINPNLAVGYLNLALAQIEMGRAGEAAGNLDRYLARKPGDRSAQALLAELYLKLKQPADAIPLLRAIVAAEPGNTKARKALRDAELQAALDPS
jgi:tetratricopeptide (TPR) repeat protein